MEFRHKSVLLRETMEYLKINPDGIYVDGTLGGGGHALEICRRLSSKGKLIGIDQDEDAVRAASERLAEFEDRTEIVRSNYRQMAKILSELGIGQVDGILLDLGVSSYQLDELERGFTYRTEDAPLDMALGALRRSLRSLETVNEICFLVDGELAEYYGSVPLQSAVP